MTDSETETITDIAKDMSVRLKNLSVAKIKKSGAWVSGNFLSFIKDQWKVGGKNILYWALCLDESADSLQRPGETVDWKYVAFARLVLAYTCYGVHVVAEGTATAEEATTMGNFKQSLVDLLQKGKQKMTTDYINPAKAAADAARDGSSVLAGTYEDLMVEFLQWLANLTELIELILKEMFRILSSTHVLTHYLQWGTDAFKKYTNDSSFALLSTIAMSVWNIMTAIMPEALRKLGRDALEAKTKITEMCTALWNDGIKGWESIPTITNVKAAAGGIGRMYVGSVTFLLLRNMETMLRNRIAAIVEFGINGFQITLTKTVERKITYAYLYHAAYRRQFQKELKLKGVQEPKFTTPDGGRHKHLILKNFPRELVKEYSFGSQEWFRLLLSTLNVDASFNTKEIAGFSATIGLLGKLLPRRLQIRGEHSIDFNSWNPIAYFFRGSLLLRMARKAARLEWNLNTSGKLKLRKGDQRVHSNKLRQRFTERRYCQNFVPKYYEKKEEIWWECSKKATYVLGVQGGLYLCQTCWQRWRSARSAPVGGGGDKKRDFLPIENGIRSMRL